MTRNKGYIHLYTGDGKGKTTASLGLAMRAAGWGRKVCIFQFMKKMMSGERKASVHFGKKLKIVTFDETHPIFCRKSARKRAAEILKRRISADIEKVKKILTSENYDIIILDEIISALSGNFVTKDTLISLIDIKPVRSELILTGRGAPGWLINKADYVTAMRPIKHPFTKGLKAREGIEY